MTPAEAWSTLDAVGSIALAALFVGSVAALVQSADARARGRGLAYLAAGVFAAGVVAAAAAGVFAPGTTGPVPAVGIVLTVALVGLAAAWRGLPGFRAAMLSIPEPALVGVHAGRLLGVFFLLLAAAGRLSEPFAPVAGWGDVAVGALAVPLAWAAVRRRDVPGLGLWNAFGALDLVVAVGLGVLSAPGTPFRVFASEPGTLAMGTLPWVLIPTLLVPLFLLSHGTILAKRLASRRAGREAVPPGAAAAAGTVRTPPA